MLTLESCHPALPPFPPNVSPWGPCGSLWPAPRFPAKGLGVFPAALPSVRSLVPPDRDPLLRPRSPQMSAVRHGARSGAEQARQARRQRRGRRGPAGRSCLCPRHRRRRHLGGGLRGAYGKAWRRGARAAGSRSAHCGGAEQGSRAGSEDDAESSARGARARGPGWGHAAARAQGFFGGGIPWPCIDRSGKPPRVGDRGTGAWLWWPAPLREGKGLQPRGTALLRCWDSSLGVVVDADEEPNNMLFEPAVGCRG